MTLANRIRSLSLLSLLFPFSYVQAQGLSLDEYILTVYKNNPGVQAILADEAIATARLNGSHGIDDTVVVASLGQAHSEPDPITGKEASQIDKQDWALAVERIISQTGTRLSLAYGSSTTEQLDPQLGALTGPYQQPSLTLQLTQPLLKNFGGIQDRLNIKQERLGLELARLGVREEIESYISKLSALYLDWYLAYREMQILKRVYEQVIEQEKVIRLKVKRQVSESHELLRIQETRQDYYSRWQISIGKYRGLGRQIRNQMATATQDQDYTPQAPRDSRLLGNVELTGDHQRYLQEASRLRRVLDLLAMQKSNLLQAKEDARSADLSLGIRYSLHGVEDSSLAAAETGMHRNDYSLSLQYRYPLGNRQAGGRFREELASQRKLDAEIQKRLIDARSSLDNYVEQIHSLEQALAASNKKLELAQKKIKQENRLYKIGRLDLFQLIQDQKSLLESQISNVQTQTQLLKLKLGVGELLDRNLKILAIKEL